MLWHAYNRRIQEANRTAEKTVLQDMLQMRREESNKCQQVQKMPLGSVASQE
jgi:hypothetical protein